MADITTAWDGTSGDWVQLGAALQSGDDLTTACLLSIFSDARADPDDVIPDAPQDGAGDPRGWWGDAYADKPIGSKLWLRRRSKQTSAVLNAVRNDIEIATQWLIDDGVVASIDVACAWLAPGFLGASIELFKQDGTRAAKIEFRSAWSSQSQG